MKLKKLVNNVDRLATAPKIASTWVKANASNVTSFIPKTVGGVNLVRGMAT